MKASCRTIALLVFFLLAPILARPQVSAAQAASPFFYYADGTRFPLTLNPARVAVRFRPQVDDSSRRAVTSGNDQVESYDRRTDEKSLGLSLLPVRAGKDARLAVSRFKQRDEVQAAGNVFQFPDGTQYAETGEFVVRFKAHLSPLAIGVFNWSNGVQALRQQPYSKDVFILRPLAGNPRTTLELANAYAQSGWVEFAEPNFAVIQERVREPDITAVPQSSVAPNDSEFWRQWSLQNTQQFQGSTAGADINAARAWGITKGSSGVTIAIIDEGVDPDHPDLQGQVLPGINLTVYPNTNNARPSNDDYHGTAIAGIAAAASNNSQGIAGVCWFCRILPVKVATENPDGSWATTTSWLASGIDWAWQNGGDILSNSWTLSGPSDNVKNAIINANSGGHGGWGSVVIFSVGNQNASTIPFPAYLNNYVIAVGASNWCDQRKTPASSSSDGCNHYPSTWGSNYGSALDLLAPGEAIYTTCASDTYCWFSGTSASAPMVAGIAGLIDSLNPNLTPSDVQNVLQSGVVDLGPAGRDSDSGYGRVDAYRSLEGLYDLSVGVSHPLTLSRPGDTVQFTVNYANNGLTAMREAALSIRLSAGLGNFNSSSAFVARGEGVYDLGLGQLDRYATGSITFNATVQPGASDSNAGVQAQIAGAFPELDTGDNSSQDSVAIAAADLFLPFVGR